MKNWKQLYLQFRTFKYKSILRQKSGYSTHNVFLFVYKTVKTHADLSSTLISHTIKDL